MTPGPLTMKGRLMALACLALAGLVLLAALAWGSNQVTRIAMQTLFERDMQVLMALQRLQNGLLDVRFRAAGVLLEQLPVPGSLNHVREVRRQFASEWTALRRTAAAAFVEGEAQQAWTALDEHWPRVDKLLARLEAGYDSKDSEVLTEVLEDDWPGLHIAVIKPLEALIPALQQAADAAYARTRDQSRRLLLGGMAAALACVMCLSMLAWRTVRALLRPLAEVRDAMGHIASGDLASPLPAPRRDELGGMVDALRAMQERLRALVSQVRGAAESIQVASGEVAQGNADLSSRTEQTAGRLQQTAASMTELAGTVRQSASASGEASALAQDAAEVAQRGGAVVGQVVSTMNDIHASSQKIADIIGTIDGIAFQTNILALNAAVEAARAGDQGRGFAVVAGEVRALAQRSATAAREIKSLIGASVERVEAGSRLVGEAGSTMGEIVSGVGRVSSIIGEISRASGEQSQGLGEVSRAVGQLDEMTQRNAALVEESAAAAESLREQAFRLAALVSTFRLAAA
jgi:methyl-accepting chemotaxis protein